MKRLTLRFDTTLTGSTRPRDTSSFSPASLARDVPGPDLLLIRELMTAYRCRYDSIGEPYMRHVIAFGLCLARLGCSDTDYGELTLS